MEKYKFQFDTSVDPLESRNFSTAGAFIRNINSLQQTADLKLYRTFPEKKVQIKSSTELISISYPMFFHQNV